MSTVSGGSSWTQQVPPDGTSQLKSVACPDTSECVAVGVDSVLASPNAGHTWSTVPIPSDVSGLNGISCPTIFRLHRGGLWHLRQPSHHRNNRSGDELDDRNRVPAESVI